MADGYVLDLTARPAGAARVRCEVGGEPVELTLRGLRRREARALAQLAGAGPDGFVDALYECCAVLLSNNDRGAAFTADDVAGSLTVAECEGLVLAAREAFDAEVRRLGKG